MSIDLVVGSQLSSSLQTVQDQTPNNSALAISTVNVTVGLPTYVSNSVNDGKLLTVIGSESTANGFGASVTISNQAPGGANWYLRAGAAGTDTPPGGFSIANDAEYFLTMAPPTKTSPAAVGILTNLNVSGALAAGLANVSGALTAGSASVSGTLTAGALSVGTFSLPKISNQPPSGAQLRGLVVDINTGNLYYL